MAVPDIRRQTVQAERLVGNANTHMPPRSIQQCAESTASFKSQSIMNVRSRIFFLWMFAVMLSMPVFAQQGLSLKAAPACPAILQHQFPQLQDGSLQNLCQYAGKAVLVVNTASYCGFTGQYEGLEALYAKYEKQGLVVLGFPSNDFGKQEPGSSKEIADFCFNTYGVKFPMFSKSVVSGSGKNALFTALEKATGVAPKWNFHKYLIDRNGKVVGSFSSEMEPQNPKLLSAVEKVLK